MNAGSADVERLIALLAPYKRVLILTHNNPDPDSLASAAALKHLIRARCPARAAVAYSGFLTRAENREMVRELRLPARPLDGVDMRRYRAVILVDTQPGAGNNALSARQTPLAIIDHHGARRRSRESAFHVVEPDCGATSTILYEMMKAAGVEPPANIATALFYGIKTDTLDLGREATERDRAAYRELSPLARHATLARITHPRVPAEYFRVVTRALEHAVVYGHVVYAPVGPVATPEYVSAIADYVLALDGMRWSVATGESEGDLVFSIRTLTARKDASRILRRAIGAHGAAGGHHKMAGGILRLSRVDAEHREALASRVVGHLLGALGANTAGGARPMLAP